MAGWGWIASVYAAYVAAIAVTGRARQRRRAIGAAALFALASAGAATIDRMAVQLIVPGAVALAGYWLSGLFVGIPQPWLERRLLESDRTLFARLSLDRALASAPRWVLELLELSYATVYLVVMAGAVVMAMRGVAEVQRYWMVVLASGFVCYAALPFLRCRPPRRLEPPGAIARRRPLLRRLNERVVAGGSIQANTIPSGHVATAVAAALVVASADPVMGALWLGGAVLIAVAATAGRYHYAIDCVLGAAVALVVWLVA